MAQRGDVVIVDFPVTDVPAAKRCPALVVQNDRDNQRLRKTVVALITGNLRRRGDPSHVFVHPSTPDGAASGLYGPSLVSCNNLLTVEHSSIVRTVGLLAAALMQLENACFKSSL